jgi:RHS repeat-associated protein
VIGVTDSSGNLVASYTYDSWGKQSSAEPPGGPTNPWRYGSGYWDSQTKLLKFGLRYYDASNGRFTTPDEKGGPAVYGWDTYIYAADDPINNVDPTGAFCLWSCVKKLIHKCTKSLLGCAEIPPYGVYVGARKVRKSILCQAAFECGFIAKWYEHAGLRGDQVVDLLEGASICDEGGKYRGRTLRGCRRRGKKAIYDW